MDFRTAVWLSNAPPFAFTSRETRVRPVDSDTP